MTPSKKSSDIVLQCDSFDVNFKNLIADAVDIWQKAKLKPY